MSKSTIKCEVVFAEPPDLPSDAVIRVTLRDTSEADAMSKVVAERVLKGVERDANERGKVTFDLPVDMRDERASYTLSVHVDLQDDGRLKKGDYINMQSYPVSAAQPPDEISVQVKKIKL